MKRQRLFVCVGTEKHLLDSVAPRVGTILSELGYLVLGTMNNQVHATNLHKFKIVLDAFSSDVYEVIGVDATNSSENKMVVEYNRPLQPGSGIGRKLPEIGEKTIGINIMYNAKHKGFWGFWHRMIFSSQKDERFVENLVECTVNYILKKYPEDRKKPVVY